MRKRIIQDPQPRNVTHLAGFEANMTARLPILIIIVLRHPFNIDRSACCQGLNLGCASHLSAPVQPCTIACAPPLKELPNNLCNPKPTGAHIEVKSIFILK